MLTDYLTIALPKGKLFARSVELLAKVGYAAENVREDSRKLVISNEEAKVRFIITKTVDLPTYVEYGAADIGIIGKDVLLEAQKDVYELLDLGYGACRLMAAVPADKVLPSFSDYTQQRVATKYPHCAREFLTKQGIQMDIIKLNGSIELGPLIGLSEMIIDIVETGTTLKENNLTELATVFTSTARLIANRASFRLKFAQIGKLVKDLEQVLKENKK